MSDYDASPVILVSRLAEHTKNIGFDARVSLMVHERGTDMQAAARLTLAGTCERIEGSFAAADRYVRLFPSASDYLALDFEFYRIAPTAIRYIGGFGSVHWLAPEPFRHDGGIDSPLEREWLEHLNRDRKDDLQRLSARHRGGDRDSTARAVALDCDGIDLAADERSSRLPFAAPITSPADLPAAIKNLFDREAG